MPELLLLNTLRIRLEVAHEVLDLFDLGIGIGVHDLSQIFHQAEIGSHSISQTSQLTELRKEGNLITSASVFVNQERLIHVIDVLVVAGLVVLTVGGRSPILVESGGWTLTEVNSIDFVSLLIVASDHSASCEGFLDGFLAITTALFSFVSQILHVIQTVVSPYYFKADIDI